MPDRSSKPKRPRDINQIAAEIVEESTREYPERDEPTDVNVDDAQLPEKNPHAQALGRLGGLKGGKARAQKLSAERKREIAKRAAEARWHNGKRLPKDSSQ